jgi:hypothetical protein
MNFKGNANCWLRKLWIGLVKWNKFLISETEFTEDLMNGMLLTYANANIKAVAGFGLNVTAPLQETKATDFSVNTVACLPSIVAFFLFCKLW